MQTTAKTSHETGAETGPAAILTDEVMKSANPGMNDFGSGMLVVVSSQCLRCTKKTLDCTVCSDLCPVGGINTSFDGRPSVTNKCIKCGVCMTACPTDALAVATRPPRQVSRLLMQATLRTDYLVIGCERTSALLRLQVRTDAPEAAIAGLKLIKEARAKEQLMILPCLAMMSREMWFSVLNEIDVVRIKELGVLLPPEQCAQCPVNAKGNIEDIFAEAITVAETWTGHEVSIVTELRDLPRRHLANVRAFLASEREVDRRGLFTGFVGELKQSWDDNATVGNRALEEAQIQRLRRESFALTRLSDETKKKIPSSARPIETPSRHLLVEALGRSAAHADDVEVSVSCTDFNLCELCGACADVCPVRARKLIGGELSINELYCVGCSACMQVCPKDACHFTEISGRDFLLPSEPE